MSDRYKVNKIKCIWNSNLLENNQFILKDKVFIFQKIK